MEKATLIATIEQVLDEEIRPLLAAHQGNVAVNELTDDGTLYIRLTGMCSSCASASETTQEIIATRLQARIPEIQKVALEEGVSDELIQEALKILHHE